MKINTIANGGYKSMQHGLPWNSKRTFTTPGNFEFIVPEGISKIRALVWGGGGSGADGSEYQTGGGGGGFTEHVWSVSPGAIISMIVANGGERL